MKLKKALTYPNGTIFTRTHTDNGSEYTCMVGTLYSGKKCEGKIMVILDTSAIGVAYRATDEFDHVEFYTRITPKAEPTAQSEIDDAHERVHAKEPKVIHLIKSSTDEDFPTVTAYCGFTKEGIFALFPGSRNKKVATCQSCHAKEGC